MSFTDNINGIPAQDTVLRQGIATLRNTVISNTIKPLTVDHNGVYTANPNNGTYGYSPVTVDTGVYTGATAPDNSLGKDGDYYYRVTDEHSALKDDTTFSSNSINKFIGFDFEPLVTLRPKILKSYNSNSVTGKFIIRTSSNVIYDSGELTLESGWNSHTVTDDIELVPGTRYILAIEMNATCGRYRSISSTSYSKYIGFKCGRWGSTDYSSSSTDSSDTYSVDMDFETDTERVAAEYIKDNDAWVSISSADAMILTTLSVNNNGTYNAPTGTAYSSVSVNVGPEIISRSDWNALTTAQKQAKGLIIIQDSSSGFLRGEYINGADYVPKNKYIPYSDEYNVYCEAYVDNFDGASDTWGFGTSPLHYVDNTHKPLLDVTENAVYIQTKTNGVVPYVDIGYSQMNYTIYFIARLPSPTGQYERLVSCAYGYDSGNSSVICRSNNSDVLMFSTWANDTNTSHDIKDYCVACLKLINDNGSKTTKMYLYDGTEVTSMTKVLYNIARYICIGKFDISSSSNNQYPSDSYFKYFAVVNGAETDAVIENNIMHLYNEFLTE